MSNQIIPAIPVGLINTPKGRRRKVSLSVHRVFYAAFLTRPRRKKMENMPGKGKAPPVGNTICCDKCGHKQKWRQRCRCRSRQSAIQTFSSAAPATKWLPQESGWKFHFPSCDGDGDGNGDGGDLSRYLSHAKRNPSTMPPARFRFW